ncbi:7291_t:CDS:2 [Diversispora eburnea]|uniref:7291_t:CDS:1 n=1 Tax=Diversispora eburnea TaxID=1213867 RepID=A0A9N8ZJ31_9GLOM|nr:7291_t:CDS:2 [Diversispora eburnea]
MNPEKFPLLSPIDLEGLSYCGFITVKGQELFFRIQHENSNLTLRNVKLYGCPNLKRLLHGHENALQQELIMISEKPEPMPTGKYYLSLLSELNSIGWEKLEILDPSLRNLTLKLSDSSSRKHIIYISIPTSYPHALLNARADIPSISMTKFQAANLKDVINYYSKEFGNFQEVWEMLDDIDLNTWVLEPDKPKRSDLMRRIALGNHCSLKIEIDVNYPRKECQYELFGTESLIAPLHIKIAKNWNNWDTNLTVRRNFENILEITFPSFQTSLSSDINFDCGICYSYHFEGTIPDQSCNNNKCGQSFHRWLQAIPSTKKNFNTLIGNCPYCNDVISTIREQ